MIARLLTALLVLGAAGCGGDGPRQAPPVARAVEVSLDLERPPAGPPDAGTQAGHRAGAAQGETSEATFSVTGTVSPAQSEVTITAAREGPAATVLTPGDHGDFIVELSGLAPGSNRFALRAAADGYAAWEQDIVITRR